jgi:hypothetical protein
MEHIEVFMVAEPEKQDCTAYKRYDYNRQEDYQHFDFKFYAVFLVIHIFHLRRYFLPLV